MLCLLLGDPHYLMIMCLFSLSFYDLRNYVCVVQCYLMVVLREGRIGAFTIVSIQKSPLFKIKGVIKIWHSVGYGVGCGGWSKR